MSVVRAGLWLTIAGSGAVTMTIWLLHLLSVGSRLGYGVAA